VARKRRKDKETGGFEGEAEATSGERARLTPVDVQQKVFRLAFRGYNERDVDEFLDRVTEDLAALHEENKRLREQVTEGGTGVDASGADRQAEAIVRQAREHAARLVEEAERRAASAGGGTSGLPGTFLLQERQFLQQMATLIQGHAQRLKEEARRARPTPEESSTGGTPETPTSETGVSGAGAAAAGAAVIGGAAAVGGAAAAEDEPPTPAPEPPPAPSPQEPSGPEAPPPAAEPPPPEEATAPWSPIEERSPGQGERASTGEQGDQLVSAWESAFSGDSGEPAAEEGARREDEGEPSLRELFWGEES
jgi:DivIVA domain-containing protein